MEHSWGLANASLSGAVVPEYFAGRVVAVQGIGWVLVASFDAQCKADGLGAFGDDLMNAKNSPNRSKLEAFLAANKAQFRLHVVQTGPENSAVKTVLEQTQCSPTDLGACADLAASMTAAMQSTADLNDSDYNALVTSGNAGQWIIGAIQGFHGAGLP